MSEPLFSIVMPVRDGEATFGWALESALHQDFDDYEIVILDNNSHDATSEIIANYDDRRIRPFRNDETLPMPDNFEKAWGLAGGTYVLYLCDDDALLPTTLGRLARVLREGSPELVSWEYAFFYHPDWHTPAEQNILRIIPASGAVAHEASEELSKLVYSFKEPKWAPRMQNCCVRRTVFEEIRKRYGRLFLGPCPDYFFLALTLHNLKEMVAIHRPLHIAGRSSGSVGAIQATTLGEEAERFLDESGGETALRAGPCGIPVLANFIAATLKNAGVLITREGGKSTSIDLVECFGRAARNVKTIERYTGAHRNDMRGILYRAAEGVSQAAVQAVSKVLDSKPRHRSPLTRIADGIIGKSRMLSKIEVALRFGGDPNRARRWFEIENGVSIRNNEVYVDGEAIGVHDIIGMTKIVDPLFERLAQPRVGAA